MPEEILVIVAIVAVVVFIAIVQRGRRLRDKEQRDRRLREEEAGPTFGELLNRQDVLILDTETTGLGKGAEVVEIAIVDTTGATRLNTVVMPVGRINSEASDIHGLTRKKLRELKARHWSEIHDHVCELLDGAAIVTGWKVSFDIRILQQTTRKHDLVIPMTDTFDMLDFYRRTRRRRYNGLSDAMRDEKLAWEGPSHRAESDCRAVLAIMQSLAKSDRGPDKVK